MANADNVASRYISRLLPVLTIVSALAWNITANAADLQWSADGITPGGGGTGNWNTTGANVVWFNDTTMTFQAWNNVPADPHNAFFGGTAGTVTITNNIIAHDLFFDTTGYTVIRTGGNTLTLGGVSPTVDVVAGGSAIINAPVAGIAGLTYLGPGTLILGQNNTYTGGTTISGGTLQIGNGSTTGAVVGNIANEGALVFNRSNAQTYAGDISGSGTLTKEGANTLILSGNNVFTGLTTINTGTLQIGSGANGSFEADILNHSALIFSRTGATSLDYAGTIDGAGTVEKTGNGIVTLTGTNTYTGETTISTGTLRGGATNAFSAASAHTVTSGDFLDLGGFDQIIGSLTGSGRVTNSGVDAATLSTGADDTSTTFAGIIQDGTGGTGLTKTGTDTMTLTGTNTYTGITTISDGTLEIGAGGTAGSIASLSIVNDAALVFNRNTTGVTYGGVISGSGTLTKNGTNTLTLTGDNTFTGLTTINAGTLQIGNGGTTGAIVGDVVNNTALRFNRSDALTYGGDISGAGTLTKTGAGTLTLSGSNTYTGNTTISGGAIAVSAEDNLGDISSGLILGGGTLQYLTGFASDRGITLNSGGGTVNTNGNDATLGGTIGGTSTLTKTGTGTLTLTGTNTYAGDTTISGGTLQLGDGGATGSIVSDDVINNGELAFNRNDQIVFSAEISGSGTLTQAGTGTTVLSNNNSFTGATTISAGTLQIGNGGGAGAVTSDIVNNAALVFNRTGATQLYAGDISGSGTLTKEGTNILTLTGDNTFTGLTTINAGTLQIGNNGATGSIASDILNNSVLIFNRTGTLTYDGVISGAGTLTKTGSGILELTGSNTYTGDTSIINGTLLGGATNAFSAASAHTITSSGDFLDLGGFDQTIGSLAGTTGRVTNTGALDATLTTGGNDTSTTFAGIIQDGTATTGLTKVGTGTMILTGVNTYTGITTISGGTLQLGNGGVGSIANSASIVNDAALVFNRNGTGVTYNGVISGSGTLTKEGTNILTLTGDNTFTGITTINAGTLEIGNGGATGAIVGDIVNNTALRFNRSGALTYGGMISGAGTLTKTGTGTLTLSGSNTYTGNTTISNGAIAVSAEDNLGDLSSTLILGGGTLQYLAGFNSDRAVTLNSGGGTIDTNGFDATLGGTIAGTSTLTKAGTGTLTLTGENTYAGDTTISGGTLQLGDGGATGSIVSDDVINNGVLAFNRNDQIVFSAEISGNGALTQDGTGTTILTNTNTYTGITTINAGTLQIGNGGSVGSIASASNIVNDAALVVDRTGTLVYGGDISGGGTLTKDGGGTFTLTGDNTFTGLTTINAGTLQIGNNGATGSITSDIVNNTALIFNRTGTLSYGGMISGAGTLTKTGSGIVELTGTNTYTGDTMINAGRLQGGAENVFSAASAHIISSTNDFLDLGGFNQIIGSLASASGGSRVTNDGAAGATLTTGDNDTTTMFAGVIQDGTGVTGLTKSGTGTMILTGTNTYSGITTITEGTLQIGSGGGGGSIASASNIVNDTALVVNRTGTLVYGGDISGGGTLTKNGGGTFTLTGGNTFTGLTTINAGTLQIGNNGATGSIVSDVVNNAALVFDRSNNLTYAGEISGTGTLTKDGDGTLNLTGNNTFGGTTTVEAGILLVNGTNANSAVTVESGATLGGTGTVGATVIENGGTLSPGNSIDTIDINSDLTFSGSSIYEVEFEPLSNDLTNVAGIAFLAGTVNAIAAPGVYAAGSYLILNAVGGINSTFDSLTVQGSFGMSAKLDYDANNVFLLLGEVAWQGGTSTDWFTAANWDSGTVPTASDTTIIDTVTPNPTVIALAGAESGEIQIGNSALGEGSLTIENGGTLDTTGDALVGQNGGTGEVVVTGASSEWTMTGELQLGGASGTEGDGRLTIADGATVNSGGANLFQTAATDTRALVTGSGSTWNSGPLQIVGDPGFAFDHLAVEDGATVNSGDVDLIGKALITGTDSTWNIAGDLTIGGAGGGGDSVTIDPGATVNVGNGAGVVFNGVGPSNAEVLNINGGALNASEVVLAGTSSVNFMHNNPNYVFAPRITGGGGMVFIGGGGKTIFTADNDYTALTQITNGTLQLGDGGTTGAITGDVEFTAGGGTLVFHRSNTLTYGGTISGGGSVEQNGAGTTVLTGNNTYTGTTTVNAGTLVVDGSIANSSVLVNDTGMIRGSGWLGAINVRNGGIVAPGDSIGTIRVIGSFTLNPGAIFEAELNAAGQNDRVVVSGTVNLTGSTLRVLAENGNYRPRTEYLIVENDGNDAVNGEFAELTTNLAFLTPVVLYDGGTGNDVVLILLNDNNFSFCSEAITRNQCNVAHALDRFPTTNPLFLAVLNQTAEGARQAFDALSGEIHATLPGILADDSRYVREAVLGRLVQATYTNNAGQLAALGAGGPQVASLNTGIDAQAMALGYDGKSLSAPPRSGAAFWTRGYGAWGDFEGDGNAASADRDLGGFISGIDTQISGTWRAGLAAGGSWSNISVGDRHSHAEVESFQLAGYAGGMAGPLALRGGGAWAWADVDTDRAVMFPGFFERQSTSYDADTGQIFGEVAYPIASGRVAFEPFAGLAYVSVETDSFRERGGALASLNGGSDDEDVGYSTLGLRAATAMHWNTMLVIPKVSAAWQHAFDDVTPGTSLAFATTGIGFGIDGVPLAQDSLLLEAGLDFNISATATLGVSYSGQFADDVTDNAVKGRLTWLF